MGRENRKTMKKAGKNKEKLAFFHDVFPAEKVCVRVKIFLALNLHE